MPTSPNPPPWAAKVWFQDAQLHVDLPQAQGGMRSHRLSFPCDLQGLIRLRHLLEQRGAHSMIGEAGDLTQHQLNKKLRTKVNTEGVKITRAKPKDKFAPELRAAARGVLRKLGMIGAVQR